MSWKNGIPYDRTEGDARPPVTWRGWIEFIFIILLIGGILYTLRSLN